MKNTLLLLLLILCYSCGPTSAGDDVQDVPKNPAAEGFNMEDSDERAIALADSVMVAMGGRKAWDQTRFLSWNFFGRRKLIWDKKEGDVRIEIPSDSTIFLVNVFSKKGKAMIQGEEITEPDSLSKLMDRAEAIWINDSYWLIMPFKLKDSGVTLKYLGQDTASTQENMMTDVLSLTFNNVGNSPDNKYHVFVDPDSKLIVQWDYFRSAEDETPRISTPWNNYSRFGEILLSGDRGGRRQLVDIGVFENIPQAVFNEFSARFND